MYWGMNVTGEEKWRKGPWTAEEDDLLIRHVNLHGEGRWNSVATFAGVKRNGKSCRLRWVNYLRPDLKRGRITPNEEAIILQLHARWGNRWSTIARSLPGRTDNEIKNYWRTHFKKKTKVGALDESTKLKKQLLKRQKFQQQQRLRKQQNHINNITNIMSLLEESDENIQGGYMVEGQQDKIYEQSPLPNSGLSYYVPPMIMNEDVGLWDGLWNLDDIVHAPNFCAAKAT